MRSPVEADLVAVWVTEGGFADTIVIGPELFRLEAVGVDRGKLPVEVIDEDRDRACLTPPERSSM